MWKENLMQRRGLLREPRVCVRSTTLPPASASGWTSLPLPVLLTSLSAPAGTVHSYMCVLFTPIGEAHTDMRSSSGSAGLFLALVWHWAEIQAKVLLTTHCKHVCVWKCHIDMSSSCKLNPAGVHLYFYLQMTAFDSLVRTLLVLFPDTY